MAAAASNPLFDELGSIPLHAKAPAPDPNAGKVAARNRKPRIRSCERCRKQRLRCEDGTPCKRCKNKMVNQPCSDCDPLLEAEKAQANQRSSPGPFHAHQWTQEMVAVDRNVSFQPRFVELPEPITRQIVQSKVDLVASRIGGGAWVSHRTMKQLAEGMTEELLDSVLIALKGMAAASVSSGISTILASAQLPPPEGVTVEIIPDDMYLLPTVIEHHQWYGKKNRISRIEFNRQYAEHVRGCRAEELMARIAHEDVGLSITQLEYLCSIIDSLGMIEELTKALSRNPFAAVKFTRYLVSTPGLVGGEPRGPAVLMRQDRVFSLDYSTAVCKSVITMTPVTAEEFDAAGQSNPNLCRPFCQAVGDRRSTKQVLLDRPQEHRTSLAQMRQSSLGQRVMAQAAQLFRDRFSGMQRAADNLAAVKASVSVPPSPASAGSPSPQLTKPTTAAMPNGQAESPINSAPPGFPEMPPPIIMQYPPTQPPYPQPDGQESPPPPAFIPYNQFQRSASDNSASVAGHSALGELQQAFPGQRQPGFHGDTQQGIQEQNPAGYHIGNPDGFQGQIQGSVYGGNQQGFQKPNTAGYQVGVEEGFQGGDHGRYQDQGAFQGDQHGRLQGEFEGGIQSDLQGSLGWVQGGAPANEGAQSFQAPGFQAATEWPMAMAPSLEEQPAARLASGPGRSGSGASALGGQFLSPTHSLYGEGGMVPFDFQGQGFQGQSAGVAPPQMLELQTPAGSQGLSISGFMQTPMASGGPADLLQTPTANGGGEEGVFGGWCGLGIGRSNSWGSNPHK